MSMRTRAGKKISLTNYEELLAVPTIEGASDIPLDQLHEFKGHGVSTDYILKGDKTVAPSDALLEELGALVQKYKSL